MSLRLILWMLAGAGAGLAHATALWRSANQWRERPFAALWRMPLVAALLVGAAVSGSIITAAAGWASGFGLAGVVLAARSGR